MAVVASLMIRSACSICHYLQAGCSPAALIVGKLHNFVNGNCANSYTSPTNHRFIVLSSELHGNLWWRGLAVPKWGFFY